MPLTPEERRLIRQNNARRSTGPKTAEGKARSRGNALKHGLRAETLSLPSEDPAVAAERSRAWNDYYQPESPAAQHLVNACVQATLLHDRCVQHHHAVVTKQVREAQEQWDRRQADEVETLKNRLDDDPAEAVRLLRRSSFGCAWLLGAWDQLDAELRTQGHWSPEALDQAFRLLGVRQEEKKAYAAQLDPAVLRALIDGQRAELSAERTRLWNEFEAPDRAEAADRALLPHDPNEARLFLRYHAEARTSFHRACRELTRLLTEGEPGGYPPEECPWNIEEPSAEQGWPVAGGQWPLETAAASDSPPAPVAAVSPNEADAASVARTGGQVTSTTRRPGRVAVSPNEANPDHAAISPNEANPDRVAVSPNEANPDRATISPNEANRPGAAVSPNEAEGVPRGPAEGWIAGPDASDSDGDWFGLPAWPGASPSVPFANPGNVLV
jgi:hypothetical protein